MAREVPAAPKVYTTTYDNFKGVDFTNDATNVWRRRSPTGVNMLPDASGRPFKRHGWNILLSNEQICTALGQTDCQIEKCSYFELAGVDHIVVFTNNGVLFYNGIEVDTPPYTVQGVTAINNTDMECYTGFDRSFFFEGNGMSAFYIYGEYRVWRYESDFQLHEVTDIVTVPRVLISTSADGTGTFYEGYNLLGTKASIEYNDYVLFTSWASDGLQISVPDSFKTSHTIDAQPLYKWEYDGSAWTTVAGGVTWASAGITVSGTPKAEDQVVVLHINGVMLPNNVTQDQIPDVNVRTSLSTQFDYDMPINDYLTPPPANECRLFTDTTKHRARATAWIQFAGALSSLADGEDFIKVTFPTVNITITPCSETGTGTASLVGA